MHVATLAFLHVLSPRYTHVEPYQDTQMIQNDSVECSAEEKAFKNPRLSRDYQNPAYHGLAVQAIPMGRDSPGS